jgi:hypothetical protein
MGYDFLSTATLTRDEHSRIRDCDSLDQRAQLYDRGMIANKGALAWRLESCVYLMRLGSYPQNIPR